MVLKGQLNNKLILRMSSCESCGKNTGGDVRYWKYNENFNQFVCLTQKVTLPNTEQVRSRMSIVLDLRYVDEIRQFIDVSAKGTASITGNPNFTPVIADSPSVGVSSSQLNKNVILRASNPDKAFRGWTNYTCKYWCYAPKESVYRSLVMRGLTVTNTSSSRKYLDIVADVRYVLEALMFEYSV